MRPFIIAFLALVALSVMSMYAEKSTTSTLDNVEQNSVNQQSMLSVLYQQKAAEYRALCYQAYNIASLKLTNKLKKPSKVPYAVVVDIDETVLDNSAYNAKLVKDDAAYSGETWKLWSDKSQAMAVPGAVGFLRYADAEKVAVFYISNRKENEMDATMSNLKQLDFPQVEYSHILLRSDKSDKEERRNKVAQNYDIVLFVGDNLNDFTNLYEKQKPYRRDYLTDSLNAAFGDRYIVLPNAMYGDWENALYNYNYKLTTEQKDSVRRASLRTY